MSDELLLGAHADFLLMGELLLFRLSDYARSLPDDFDDDRCTCWDFSPESGS